MDAAYVQTVRLLLETAPVLDRQHPRDFFDLLGMYEKEGLTPEIVECFVCYLAGHNRPVHEVLFSRDNDIIPVFNNEFIGMTTDPLEVNALLAVRERLRKDLQTRLTEAQRHFLLSLVQGEPNWDLMTCRHGLGHAHTQSHLDQPLALERCTRSEIRKGVRPLKSRVENH
jgi:hypothetical protein